MAKPLAAEDNLLARCIRSATRTLVLSLSKDEHTLVLSLSKDEHTLVLSLSKDEPICSWFDRLTTSGYLSMSRTHHATARRGWRS